MSPRHTATWAVVASVLAHVAVLGWWPAFHRPTPLAPEATPPRTLHAVLLPAPAVEPTAPPARTAPSASARAPVALAPERARTPAPATAQASPATAFTAAPPADAPPPPPQHPLDLDLPRHASQSGRWTASSHGPLGPGLGAVRGSAPVGPVAPEPTAAQQAAAAPLAPAHPSVTGVVSVRERRGDTLAQAEVRTPWGRYCMRKRQSSRMTELHDSPFGQGMQAANCDRE
ncbi:hypothetical protein [Hydrogenophaga soli]